MISKEPIKCIKSFLPDEDCCSCSSCMYYTESDCVNFGNRCYLKQAFDFLNSQQSQPTIEEIKKEWEDAGYEFGVDEDNDAWVHAGGIPQISFYTYNKSIVCRLMDIPFEIYDLMTRTVQALGWYNAQN